MASWRRRAALVLWGAWAVFLWGPPAAPLLAQTASPKTLVEQFIKDGLTNPKYYQSVNWSKVVKFKEGPYRQAIRHVYRVDDPKYGLRTYDRIFYLDDDGHVLGSTNTSRWRGPNWGAGKEKW